MATSWVKSLQCKSRAFDDVIHPTLPSTSCRNSYQNLRDVIDTPHKPRSKPKPKPIKPKPDPHHQSQKPRRSDSVRPNPKPNAKPDPIRRTVSAPLTKFQPDMFFPSVTELNEGHPSRNVVEIIFHTRWGPKGFSGRVEMVFKIQNVSRAVSAFEEYRHTVRTRTVSGDTGRCIADGNEMMRFRCLGPTSTAEAVGDGGDWVVSGGKGAAQVCTYSGSGAAHESGGGGKGRRAMLVCRVIAGRVRDRAGLGVGVGPGVDVGLGLEFDSVSGENGELLVFDSRAVLPCFLVIYKL